jgi:hypothetical protein
MNVDGRRFASACDTWGTQTTLPWGSNFRVILKGCPEHFPNITLAKVLGGSLYVLCL